MAGRGSRIYRWRFLSAYRWWRRLSLPCSGWSVPICTFGAAWQSSFRTVGAWVSSSNRRFLRVRNRFGWWATETWVVLLTPLFATWSWNWILRGTHSQYSSRRKELEWGSQLCSICYSHELWRAKTGSYSLGNALKQRNKPSERN